MSVLRRVLLLTLALPALFLVAPAEAVGFGQNVEWVGTVPLTNDSAGGRKFGNHFYLTSSTALHIFDVTNPTSPVRTGLLQFPQSPQFAQEDPDTNGKILLISNSVIDVSNKADPRIIGTHDAASHTITCVLDCTWAYASNGRIVDLRNPAKPRTSSLRWNTGKPVSSAHDVTEVAPGLVMTSSDPLMLLDARLDPERPVLIAKGPTRGRFTHGNLWPQQGTDKFLLVHGESGASVGCENASAQFVTMDATKGWPTENEDGTMTKGTFEPLGEYRVQGGLPTDGRAPINAWCTHWFETHRTFNDGGLVAMAWYEHGVRMLDVKPDGSIQEVGWFVPPGGSTSGVYWITDRIMYATDYQRSFDILEYTGPLPEDPES